MLQFSFFLLGLSWQATIFPWHRHFTTNPLSITFLARADFRKTLSGIWHSIQCLINAINFISSLVVQIGKIWHAVMQAWHCPQQRLLFNTKSSRKKLNNLVSLKVPLKERGEKKCGSFPGDVWFSEHTKKAYILKKKLLIIKSLKLCLWISNVSSISEWTELQNQRGSFEDTNLAATLSWVQKSKRNKG